MPKAQKHVLRPITVLGATRPQPIWGGGNVSRRSPLPARDARSQPGRVSYGVVNLYLTFLDNLFEAYLIGIQLDNRIMKEAGL